jgi:anti-anti-sigma factor
VYRVEVSSERPAKALERKPLATPFALTQREIWPGCSEVGIEGELDRATSEELRSVLDQAVVRRLDVLLDFSRCELIDGSAVALIVQGDTKLQEQGCQLLLRSVSGQVQRMLSLTGLAGANHGVPTPLGASQS